MNAKQIGIRIRDLRHECGLTQEALAEEASLSVSYLSHIERGKKRASLAVLVQIAAVLQTTVDYLVNEEAGGDTATLIPELCVLMQDCSDTERDMMISTFKVIKRALRDRRSKDELLSPE